MTVLVFKSAEKIQLYVDLRHQILLRLDTFIDGQVIYLENYWEEWAINILKTKAVLLSAVFFIAVAVTSAFSFLDDIPASAIAYESEGDEQYILSSEVSDEWRLANDPEYRKYLNKKGGVARISYGVSTPVVPSKLKNVKKYNVVDVSEFQAWHTPINWASLKKDGITGAIIRVGYRGYGSTGKIVKDQYFDQNISGALNAGIQVGVYFYTQAVSPAEARAEANFVAENIKKYDITLPVFFDIEHVDYDTGRLDAANLSKSAQTDLCTAFCDRIQSENYCAGVYASKYYFYDELNYKTLESKYEIWLAHYTTSTDYNGDFDVWQYSSSGQLNGIYDYVDLNLLFGTSPSKVSSVTAKQIGSSTILSWSRPKGAFAFAVKKYNFSTGKFENIAHIRGCSYTAQNTSGNDRFQIVPYKRMNGDYFLGAAYEITGDGTYTVTSPVVDYISVVETALRVEFKKDNVTGFSMTISDNANFTNSKTVSGGSSLRFDYLRPNTTYYLKAYAYITDGGKTVKSDEIRFTAKTKDLSSPTVNYASSNSVSDAIRIELNKVSSAKGYRIWLSDNPSFNNAVMAEGGSSLRFDNLKPNTSYYLRAYSYMMVDGEKYFSDPTQFRYTTFDAKTLPKPTVNFSASNGTSDAIRIEFNKQSGVNYRMRICADQSFSGSKSRVAEGGSSLRFDNLSIPNHTYHIRAVTYKTVNGKRYYSDSITFTYNTKALSMPTVNYKTSNSVESAVRIEFYKLTGITGYKMLICDNKSFKNAKSVKGGSSLRFDYLKPNTTYYFKAYTYKTVSGNHYYSDTVSFTYSTKALSAPIVNYSASNSTSNAIRIEFNKISGVSGYKMLISDNRSFNGSKSVKGGSSLRFDYLKPNTTYYFKAYTYKALNGKYYYSKTINFTYKTKA